MINPTRQDIITELVDYIELATALPRAQIIRGNQNAPSPTDTYCSVLYVTDTAVGTTNIQLDDNTLDEDKLDYMMRAKRHYSFSVQFYRDGATDLAKAFLMFGQTPAGLEFQQTSVFTIRIIESITEAASVISQNYEERAALTLELIINEKQDIVINRVAEVTINLSLDEGVVLEETIGVSESG
ncbi:MAG: hypothetical protein V3V61_01305 [Gammaproteobacteria bacterium]